MIKRFADGTPFEKEICFLLSDVQIPRTWIQNRLFYTLNREKNRLKNAKQTHFCHAKMLEVQKYFFITLNKIGFYLILAEVPGVARIIFFSTMSEKHTDKQNLLLYIFK